MYSVLLGTDKMVFLQQYRKIKKIIQNKQINHYAFQLPRCLPNKVDLNIHLIINCKNNG